MTTPGERLAALFNEMTALERAWLTASADDMPALKAAYDRLEDLAIDETPHTTVAEMRLLGRQDYERWERKKQDGYND